MRTRTLAIIFALLSLPAAAEIDIVGLWETPKGGHVEINDCGDGTPCGTIVKLEPGKDPKTTRDTKNDDEGMRNRLVLGVKMLSGFSQKKERWTGGKVYNPNDGGTYSGSLWLTKTGDLKMKGCIIWPACKTQVWTRIE